PTGSPQIMQRPRLQRPAVHLCNRPVQKVLPIVAPGHRDAALTWEDERTGSRLRPQDRKRSTRQRYVVRSPRLVPLGGDRPVALTAVQFIPDHALDFSASLAG